jgi:hypothetical protein
VSATHKVSDYHFHPEWQHLAAIIPTCIIKLLTMGEDRNTVNLHPQSGADDADIVDNIG